MTRPNGVRRTGTGEYRPRWVSWATVDNQKAYDDAMADLRKTYHDEWEGIALRLSDGSDYNAAWTERDAVLRERHRDEFDELHGDYRQGLGLPRYPRRRSILDRRNGEL